jgi:hypothetical protein
VHTFDHAIVRHVNNGFVVYVAQATIPGLDVKDSSGYERVFDKGGTHIECVEALSHC